jgi:hypothetical protein
MSVNNYHITPRNIPEERRSHQHRGGSLKSRGERDHQLRHHQPYTTTTINFIIIIINPFVSTDKSTGIH